MEQPFERGSAPDQEEWVSETDEPIPDHILELIGVTPRAWRTTPSPTGKALFLAVSLALGRSDGHKTMNDLPPQQVEVVRRSVTREKPSEQAHIQVSGLEVFGVDGARFASRMAEMLHPFLRPGRYRIQFSPQQRFIDDTYFGLQAIGRVSTQCEVLADCSHTESAEEDVITTYPALVNPGLAAGASTDQLIDTIAHELMHTHEDGELAYFIQRVQSEDRIRFPYPERFLEVRFQGQPVLWKAMANEYRSELVKALIHIQATTPDGSIERSAIAFLQDRFPGSSAAAVLEDVRMLSQQNPAINWPVLLKEAQAFRHDVALERERGSILHDFIEPIQDPVLAEMMRGLLDRSAPTEWMRIRHVLERVPPAERTEEYESLIRDLAYYRFELKQRQETEFADATHHASVFSPALLRTWRILIESIQTVVQRRLKEGEPRTAFSEESDLNRVMVTRLPSRALRASFLQHYQALSDEERTMIRPFLIEAARFEAQEIPVPAWFRARVEPFLAGRRSGPTIPLSS